ncbi:MAG: hypothetical protein Athens071424_170 [Parcubacteria group bacterium Athens0714_24]|nr:MAG: hypothetical protein Athens071424_170 [Parcubacteria group bacterium Athens0714_24]
MLRKSNFANCLTVILLATVLLITFYALCITYSHAEVIDPNAVINQRAQLEAQLQQLEAQIDNYNNIIDDKEKQATSLQRDISILDAQIAKAKAEIKLLNIKITQLSDSINQKNTTITNLSAKIDKERETLAELIKKTNELDSNSEIEIILAYRNLSDYFFVTDTFGTLQGGIQDSLVQIRGDKVQTEKEKEDLETRKAQQLQLRTIQQLEQKRITAAENDKKKILAATKGEEAKYQKYLIDTQKSAATIRSQLFLLTGSPSIPFEKAVEYATLAWQTTGVRPAFLLGVITEESNLGANVGKGNWTVDLANSRCASQRTAFVQITSALGLNPDLMPVSKKAWYGYCGGAMGPAQFMPTTWLLYDDKISSITGHNPPNPWDPKDAFVAAALLLKDNGATSNGTVGERKAALKYLAGSNWNNKAYAFYGDDVMEFATKYQSMIDIIMK